MKKIGIIGGMGPESTIEYYKILVHEYNKSMGGVSSPNLVIDSLNLQTISEWMKEDAWDKVFELLLQSVKNLVAAGAEIVIMATNTPHIVFDRLEEAVSVPMVSIMAATAEVVKAAGLKKVGLLGTRYTMQSDYYPKTFTNHGIETILPTIEEQEYIDKILWDELFHRILKPESKKGYLEVIDRLRAQGAEGIILGCTEIPLLIQQEDCDIPVFDTTKIHAMTTLAYALGEKK